MNKLKISELPVHLQYEITEVGVELSKLEDEIKEKIDSGNLVDQMEIIEVSIERQRLIDDINEKINKFQTQTHKETRGL